MSALTLEEQNRLIEDNINLVYYIAALRGIYCQDIIGDAIVEFVKAMRSYCPERGNISNYTWKRINWQITRSIKNNHKHFSAVPIDDESVLIDELNADIEGVLFFEKIEKLDKPLADIIQMVIDGYKLKEIRAKLNFGIYEFNQSIEKIKNIFSKSV